MNEPRNVFDDGYRARMHGCYRVLCNYRDAAELREWQRGWDTADAHIRTGEQPSPSARNEVSDQFHPFG
jgi:ribosome modulation factor